MFSTSKVLLITLLPTNVIAWGSIFEPLKGSNSFGIHQNSALKARSCDDEEDNNNDELKSWHNISPNYYTKSLSSSSSSSFAHHYESRYEEIDTGDFLHSFVFNNNNPFSFIDDTTTSIFGVTNPYEEVVEIIENEEEIDDDYGISCYGEECEMDCLIPEEYKRIAAETNIDVMEYLGLQRAEPILKINNNDNDEFSPYGEWE